MATDSESDQDFDIAWKNTWKSFTIEMRKWSEQIRMLGWQQFQSLIKTLMLHGI